MLASRRETRATRKPFFSIAASRRRRHAESWRASRSVGRATRARAPRSPRRSRIYDDCGAVWVRRAEKDVFARREGRFRARRRIEGKRRRASLRRPRARRTPWSSRRRPSDEARVSVRDASTVRGGIVFARLRIDMDGRAARRNAERTKTPLAPPPLLDASRREFSIRPSAVGNVAPAAFEARSRVLLH